MSVDEFFERLKYRFDGYFHSEKKSVKYFARALAMTLFAALISTIAPTLADELSSSPSMLQPEAITSTTTTVPVTESATATDTPTAMASFTPEPAITRPAIAPSTYQPLPESSDSATAEGQPWEIQPKYTLRIPASGAIDPRATTYFLPTIFVQAQDPEVEFTMACISSAGATVDLKGKGAADNAPEGDLLISGDQSGLLILSGATNKVVNALNASGGLLIRSTGGGLAGRSLTFRFVAMTGPNIKSEFCSQAQSGVITTIRALGLDLSTVKGGGKLK